MVLNYHERSGLEDHNEINMFTVGVVILSYLAGKALICRFRYCESVLLCLLSMITGVCSQHIVDSYINMCIVNVDNKRPVYWTTCVVILV